MRNKKFKKLLKKNQPDSGFTLTELLTGLIMSIFVTGALGFGLYQIMAATSKETAKTNARQDASRAVEFISDELRRASRIETIANPTNAPGFPIASGRTVVLALDIPGVDSRIVYYLQDSNSNWQGPQVLYRWGPPLNADGEYTNVNNTGAWQNEALIDGVDKLQSNLATNPCNVGAGETLTPATSDNYGGFYGCVNGTQTAAQIFLTGGIDTDSIAGNDSTYTAQTRAVVRAKDVTVAAPAVVAGTPITFRSLGADYICNPSSASPTIWTMRTDFDNSAYDPNVTYNANNPTASRTTSGMNQANQWIHEPGRQAQPINIDSNEDLIIHSIPVEATGCANSSSGNEGASRNEDLSDFVSTGYTVSHAIKFQANVTGRPDDSDFWQTFNGNTTAGYNNPNVTADGTVQVLKNGSTLEPGVLIDINSTTAPAPLYGGYDYDGDGNADRMSLGRFLYDNGYAEPIAAANSSEYNDFLDTANINSTNYDPNADPPSGYVITSDTNVLGENERIIAFEVGHTDTTQPGFDLQDNVFIMNHDAFDNDY